VVNISLCFFQGPIWRADEPHLFEMLEVTSWVVMKATEEGRVIQLQILEVAFILSTVL
jgi:hypothetical protein